MRWTSANTFDCKSRSLWFETCTGPTGISHGTVMEWISEFRPRFELVPWEGSVCARKTRKLVSLCSPMTRGSGPTESDNFNIYYFSYLTAAGNSTVRRQSKFYLYHKPVVTSDSNQIHGLAHILDLELRFMLVNCNIFSDRRQIWNNVRNIITSQCHYYVIIPLISKILQ